MSVTLAYDLIARDKGASKALGDLGDSVDKTGQKAEGLSSAFKKGLAGVGLVAGAAGAALVAGLFEAIDRGASSDKLAAQLGLDPAESKRLGKVAGDLYADAYGESFDQVNEAIGAVVSSIEGMGSASNADLESMTAKVLDLATAFDLDVGRAAQVAGQMIQSGIAGDGVEAMDLLTAALQKVPAAVREDLLDAMDEYGPFMASIGVEGERAFGLLVGAAEKGMYGIDKTGDALKEFTIRATDMSAASKVGYDALGLSQEEMSGKLLKGGEIGAAAFEQIVTGLLNMQDPTDQATAALALFGTPLEDLSVTEIPKFLESLTSSQTALGDTAGAADRMGQTLNDNAATNIEGFKRKAQQVLVDFIGNEVIPMIERNRETFVQLGIGVGIVTLEVVAAVFRLAEGFARGFAIALDAMNATAQGAFDMAGRVLSAFEASMGWLPGYGDKFKQARAMLDAFAFGVDQKASQAADDLRGFANSAGVAADGVDTLRNRIAQIQSKRVTITVDYQQVGSITSVPYKQRALGGPVTAGEPYWVGERGPELVVPSRNGHVLTAEQSRAAVRDNTGGDDGALIGMLAAVVRSNQRIEARLAKMPQEYRLGSRSGAF